MMIKVEKVNDNIPSGTLLFTLEDGVECKLQLTGVDYVDLDLKNNIIFCPNLVLEDYVPCVVKGDVTVNIDDYFPIFYKLSITFVDDSVMRLKCNYRKLVYDEVKKAKELIEDE